MSDENQEKKKLIVRLWDLEDLNEQLIKQVEYLEALNVVTENQLKNANVEIVRLKNA